MRMHYTIMHVFRSLLFPSLFCEPVSSVGCEANIGSATAFIRCKNNSDH